MTKIAKFFNLLRKRGFIARRRFWCCQSCAWSALTQEFGEDYDGGIVFMHKQDEDCWRSTGETHLAWQGDGEAIFAAARDCDLTVTWDGLETARIKISNI